MMRFSVITIFPEMIEAFCRQGVLGQARAKNLLQVHTLNPREFTSDFHKTVDDRPFGGGDGMIMLAEPLEKALRSLGALSLEEKAQAHQAGRPLAEKKVIYLSPQGTVLDDARVGELAEMEEIILLCGRYGGIDQRIINHYVDEEISIGDYVLSGGELAAGVMIDAVARKIPGVLGHEASAHQDSFSMGLMGLLETPSFTRPREYLGEKVPDILLSGNHAQIEAWKKAVSILTTLLKRPDLVLDLELSKKQRDQLREFWQKMEPQEKEILGLSALQDEDLEWLNGRFT
jgi:tRNA (guanine37-N1)-methyltransferase